MKYYKIGLAILIGLLTQASAVAQTAIIAHRGLWNERGSAQNSIESLHRAYSTRGVYGLEIDVQLTKDSTLILSHDPDIGGYRIDKTDWSVLRHNVLLRSKERISTLDEFLEELAKLPDLKLFLELKPQANEQANDYMTRQALERVRAHKLLDRTAFISFDLDICRSLAVQAPETLIMYLGADKSPKELYDLGLRGVNYYYPTFWKHPEWYDEARGLGMSVGTWTVNEPATMKYFIIPKGFDFMTTDIVHPALDVFDRLDKRPRDIRTPIRPSNLVQ